MGLFASSRSTPEREMVTRGEWVRSVEADTERGADPPADPPAAVVAVIVIAIGVPPELARVTRGVTTVCSECGDVVTWAL